MIFKRITLEYENSYMKKIKETVNLIILIFAVVVIAIASLFIFGNSTDTRYGMIYTFLIPLSIYLLLLFSLFQKGRAMISLAQFRVFRLLSLAIGFFLLFDGIGSYTKRLSIRLDWRYRNYYHWLSKNELSNIRAELSLPIPGVYPPNSRYSLVNSEVNIDKYGFRRELPDPYPALAPEDTYNIIWLGGSVVFGITSDKGDLTPPDMLQKILRDTKINNKPIRVYNAGVPGMHIEGINNSLIKRHKSIRPDIIIFYEAINTQPKESVNVGIPMALIYNSYTIDRYKGLLRDKELERRMKGYEPSGYGDSIDALTANIREYGALPLYVTFSMPISEEDSFYTRNYWDFMTPSTYWLARLVKLNNNELIIRAEKKKVTVIDSRPVMNRKVGYFIDHCHLTQSGMQVLAFLIKEKILEIIERQAKGGRF